MSVLLAGVVRVSVPPDFGVWRTRAREALQQKLEPDAVDFVDDTVPVAADLFGAPDDPAVNIKPSAGSAPPHVPKAFLDRAQLAALHRQPSRWNLLYRLL